MKKVAFICSANMCRSPMAQAIFEHEAGRRGLNVECFSAGTLGISGRPPVEEVLTACRNYGVPTRQTASNGVQDVSRELKECVRVFVMANGHRRYLVENELVAPERITLLGRYRKDGGKDGQIEDPIGQDQDAFDQCFELLQDCYQALPR